METLFIIGNGFDLNLEMQTSYSNFYDYYKTIKAESTNVTNLKAEIEDKYKNWSDLEFAFGEYTKNITSITVFDEIFDDIIKYLAEYLEIEETKFDVNKFETNKIYTDFAYPEDSIPQADKDIITSFKSRFKPYTIINIITFNYTKTIEKCLGNKFKDIRLEKDTNKPQIILNGIEHIHGFINDRMILGVNDASQIGNEAFRQDLDITEAIVKTENNQAQRHGVDTLCANQIRKANLIYIFGSSIGETDRFWWDLISKRLKEDCYLIIFEKDARILERDAHKHGRKKREIINNFLNKTSLTEEEKNEISNKIIISLNSNLFNLTTKATNT